MKKVLSIMLAVMMVSSLFAINASASVATYDGYDFVTVFDTSENVKSALPYINTSAYASGATAVSSFATVDDNEVAILKGNPDGADWVFGQNVASLTALDKFTLEFDVKVVDCSDALNVAFKTDKGVIGVYVTPATFIGAEQAKGSVKAHTAKITDLSSVKLNQWFNFKITVDKTIYNASDAEATKKNAVAVEYKKAEEESFKTMDLFTGGSYGYKVGGRLTTSNPTWTGGGAVAFSPDADAYAYCVDADDNSIRDNVEYHIDNVKLTGRTNKVTYPVTGVLVAEDFEGTSPQFIGSQGTLAGGENNKYMDFYRSDTVHTSTYGASKEFKPASLPQEFVVTADIYKEADNTQNLIIEYFTDTLGAVNTNGQLIAGVNSGIVLDESKFETGKWYTVKIARKHIVYPAVTVIDKETGETLTFNATTRATVSGNTSYNRLFFRALNTAGSISHWRIDNVMVAEAGAASILSATAEGDNVSAKLSVDAKEYAATPVLATYNEDRLVAVDFADVTLSADGAEADLAVSGAYDEAIVYLWNGLGGAPFMEAWDITDNITVIETTPDAE